MAAINVRLDARYIQARKGDESDSEHYFLVGSKKSDDQTSLLVLPPNDAIEVESKKRVDGPWALYKGTLEDRQVVVINVVFVEEDSTPDKDRSNLAPGLIPTQKVDPLPQLTFQASPAEVNSAVGEAVKIVEDTTILVDKIGKLIQKFADLGSILDPDNVMGGFTVRIANSNGQAYWSISDGAFCTHSVDPNKGDFTVSIKQDDDYDYLIGGSVTPPNP